MGLHWPTAHELWMTWLNTYPNLIASALWAAPLWLKVHLDGIRHRRLLHEVLRKQADQQEGLSEEP